LEGIYSNDIFVFGNNKYGQLGSVDKQNKNLKVKQISAGLDHTIIIDLDEMNSMRDLYRSI
jgi:hypothetical protein